MYTIYVRDLPGRDPRNITTLAIDVPNFQSASELVRNIATTYPVHLADPSATAYWFEDERGCHEIWCEGDQADGKTGRQGAAQSEFAEPGLGKDVYRRLDHFYYADDRLRDAA